jgi:hypothetical protein
MKGSPIKSKQLYNIVTKKKYYISNNVHLKKKDSTTYKIKKGQLS